MTFAPAGTVVLQAAFAQASNLAQTDTPTSPVLFTVNDRPVTEDDYERLRRGSAIFSFKSKGVTREDLENLLMNQAILINAAQADALDETVTDDRVEKFVIDLRDQQGLTSDEDYEQRIRQFGYSPETFREAVRTQLMLNQRIESLTNSVRLEPEELGLYIELHREEMPKKSRYQLAKDALKAKQDEFIEAWVEGLQRSAFLDFPPDSSLELYDPVVAQVGEHEILLSELNRNVYLNPQVAGFISSGSSLSLGLIQTFFKPQVLENLIHQEISFQYATRSGLPFIGTKAELLEQVQRFVTRNLTVTETDAKTYYRNHISAYTAPASAEIIEVKFARRRDALAFRSKLLRSGGDPIKLAPRYRGTASESRRVTRQGLPATFAKAVFDQPLKPSQRGQVTTLISNQKGATVLIARNFKAARKYAFAEVRGSITSEALAEKRASAGQKWLEVERKKSSVASFLKQVNADLEERSKRKPMTAPKPSNPIAPAPTPPAEPAPAEPAPSEPSPPKPVSPPL